MKIATRQIDTLEVLQAAMGNNGHKAVFDLDLAVEKKPKLFYRKIFRYEKNSRIFYSIKRYCKESPNGVKMLYVKSTFSKEWKKKLTLSVSIYDRTIKIHMYFWSTHTRER